MKVTSLKDVETYLYTSVVLPLKNIQAPELNFPSPITGKDGNSWSLQLQREPLERRYRRNYQRDRAQNNRRWQVILSTPSKMYLVAEYSHKTHWVRLYEEPFRKLNSMPLLGQLYKVFHENTPFTKVIMMDMPMAHGRNARRTMFGEYEVRLNNEPSRPMYPSYEPQEADYDEEVPF